MTIYSVINVIEYFENKHEYLERLDEHYHTEDYAPFIAISIITAILSALVTIAILHLIVLHAYLNYKGMTTYEYVIELRKKKKVSDI